MDRQRVKPSWCYDKGEGIYYIDIAYQYKSNWSIGSRIGWAYQGIGTKQKGGAEILLDYIN